MYFEVAVKEYEETEKGPKGKSRRILVEAVSVTDAEKITAELYKGSTIEYEVKGAKESNIKEVILAKK